MSDHYGRYAKLSHEELYRQLKAGRPGQVDQLASSWHSLRDSVDHVSTRLGGDLNTLGRTWTSASGREYAQRIGLIASYSRDLSTNFGTMGQSLTNLAACLREAQKHAEDPARTDDNDKAISGAEKGALIGSTLGPAGTVAGGVIGGLFGHSQDEKEQQAAHQRMIKVVADLAGEYEANQATWPAVTLPPDGLPGHNGTQDGPGTSTYAASVSARVDSVHNPATVDDPGSAGGTVTGQHPGAFDQSGSMAGVAGVVAGSGLLSASALDFLQSHPVGGGPTGSAGWTGGAAGAGGGSNGSVIGADPESGNGRAAGNRGTGPAGAEEEASGRQGAGNAGTTERSAAGTGRNRSGTMTGRGSEDGDEADERLTWLIEDDMVWGPAEPPAPGVLAVRHEPAEPA